MKEGVRMQEFLITVEIMLPLLLMMGTGWLMRRTGIVPDALTPALNRMVFRVFLPVLLFNNIRALDLSSLPGLPFSLFCVLGVLATYGLACLLTPRLTNDPRKRGVVIQGIFRSNFAVLGIALMQAMFPDSGLAAVTLALPLVVPLNNVLAVIALSSAEGKVSVSQLIKKIATNPLIIGTLLGVAVLLLKLPLPAVVDKVSKDLASLASPVALLALGASLKWQDMRENRRLLTIMLVLKQLVIPAVMLTLAILLGFRSEELGVLVILFGAPVAVSSYSMAQAMGADGDLAASHMVTTTVFSMGTLFLLIYGCKLLGVL